MSASFYGLYAVILKKKVPPEEEDNFNVSIFLGMVGMFNFLLLVPGFYFLNLANIEPFEWPNDRAMLYMTLNALIGTVISDFCWAKSVVLLGPLMTTLGITLTIPLSMCIDTFDGKKHLTWQYYIGTAFILGSFSGLSYKDFTEKDEKDN